MSLGRCALALLVPVLLPLTAKAQQPPAGEPVLAPPAAPAVDAGVIVPPEATPPPAAPEAPAAPIAPAPAPPAAAPPAGPPPQAAGEGVVAAQGTGLFEQSVGESAPPAKDAADEPADAADDPYDLDGYVRGDMFVGKVPGFRAAEIKAGYGELALQLRLRGERHGDAYAEARLRYGQQGSERDLFLELREAYVDAYFGAVDLRLGQQIIVWGRADAFNPTNNLTPFDLRIRSPIEDDRRLGNIGARTFVDLAPWRIELVWMPLYVAAQYPPIEPGEFITLSEPDFPAPELKNGLGAARVHLELSAFELSASYLYGHALLPGLALRDFTVGDPPEVRVARTAYPHHVVGFDFSTAVGDQLAIRGEAAYRHPVDYEQRVNAPRPDVQYVLGVDRAFGPVSLIVQYLGRYVLDWQREDGPDDPLDAETLAGFMEPLPRFLRDSITSSLEEELAARNQVLFMQTARLQHLASVRAEWLALHETLSLSALALVNFTTEEWLLYPKIGYRISDRMNTYLGAEVYAGPDGTLFGLIDQQLSAGYAELRYAF